ncbi:MAG TPA: hypothetical protein VEZ43_01390 [Dongiaceae bacterium]|nr:hypothetical protein [Dongiaceae bacterium]
MTVNANPARNLRLKYWVCRANEDCNYETWSESGMAAHMMGNHTELLFTPTSSRALPKSRKE